MVDTFILGCINRYVVSKNGFAQRTRLQMQNALSINTFTQHGYQAKPSTWLVAVDSMNCEDRAIVSTDGVSRET